LQEHDGLVHALHQQMIESDLAELVEQYHGALHGRRAQQVLEQRGLTAAQEAGDDVDRDAAVCGFGGHWVWYFLPPSLSLPRFARKGIISDHFRGSLRKALLLLPSRAGEG